MHTALLSAEFLADYYRANEGSELRGGAALVIAGLAASGITTVKDIRYINRGYQDIVGDLKGLGARINYVYS